MNYKRIYKLPSFPEHVGPTFRRLAVREDPSHIPEVLALINDYVARIEKIAEKRPHISVDLAKQIADRCKFLLSLYSSLDESQQDDVMGAIRYFLHHEDALADISFGTGFDDDVAVTNYVLAQLEIDDKFIDPKASDFV